ncbi:hypothetical protein GCM10023315_19510 [Algibacter aquimarinus]|uniref:Uncharacterized protein n=1 Tax=Algibacter aquimarinus TaxID=1136748 RepID=A0ABP9HFZ7_9FLAO
MEMPDNILICSPNLDSPERLFSNLLRVVLLNKTSLSIKVNFELKIHHYLFTALKKQSISIKKTSLRI